MKKTFRILSVLTLLLTASCFTPYPTAPSIDYQNMSNNFIREVKIIWNGRNLPGPHEAVPGISGGSTFDVRKKSDFYGPVHLSWQNAKGKTITRDFVFTQKHLADFDRKKKRATINLYFTQDDVLIFVREDFMTKSDDERKLGRS